MLAITHGGWWIQLLLVIGIPVLSHGGYRPQSTLVMFGTAQSSLMVTGWLQSTSVEGGSPCLFSWLLGATAFADGWHPSLLSWWLMDTATLMLVCIPVFSHGG
jgi:hypothetical protein